MKEDIVLGILNQFSWIFDYISLLAFLAPIIGGGELGVIAVAFLFSQSLKNLILVMGFSFLGMMFADSLWFFVAKSKVFNKFKKWRKIAKSYKKLEKNIENFSRGNDFFVILFAKLMMGTRILLMIYIGGRKISFGKFLIYDSLPTIIWAGILTFIGFLASRGFNTIIEIFNNFQMGITFLILFVFLIRIVGKWLNRKMLKLTKQ